MNRAIRSLVLASAFASLSVPLASAGQTSPAVSQTPPPTGQTLPAAQAAPSGAPLTLQDALTMARANSAPFRSAKLASDLAVEDRKQARAAMLPSLSAFSQFIGTEANGTPSGVFVANDGPKVYNDWLNGGVTMELRSGASILAKTSFTPLGVVRPSGITLIHPERIVDGTGIACFAAVSKGEQVTLVKSTKLGMQGRPASIIARALGGAEPKKPKGVLLAYCAGCMLAIDPDTKPMVEAIHNLIGDAPLTGAFHFGEQGRHSSGDPEHGNLMTGALVLS